VEKPQNQSPLGVNNLPPRLFQEEGRWHLKYSTYTQKNGARLAGETFLKAQTLEELVFKVVLAHRSALLLAERNQSRYLMEKRSCQALLDSLRKKTPEMLGGQAAGADDRTA
jgi:predicted GH43/DUF377 family glycosyl hydrolase